MKSKMCPSVIFLIIVFTSSVYSQYHFEIKYSVKDISAQKELFKNANVEFTVISTDKKIVFDTNGRILNSKYLENTHVYSFYKYDIEGNLILINESFFDNPTKLYYDLHGNLIRFTSDEIDEKYFYNEADKLISSEIIDQVVEAEPIESIDYQNELIIEKKWKCWDVGNEAPFTYKKTKYTYDSEQRITGIILIFGNCKTGTEQVFNETVIEYNEKNLPIKYTTTDKNGNTEIETVSYNYLN